MDDLVDGRRTSCGFFTLRELARRLECDNQTIYRNIIGQGCPHKPAGKEIFFSELSFTEWLRENEIRRGSESYPIGTGPSESDGEDQTEKPERKARARRDAETLNALPPKKRSTLPPK